MRRRRLLGLLGGSGLGAVAGCGSGGVATTSRTTTAFPRDPDDPGANLAASRGITVENRSGDRRYVTVAVAHGDETVFADTFEVAGEGLERVAGQQEVVGRSGTYRVSVEAVPAGDGETWRGSFDWRVEGALGDLRVIVSDGGVAASDRRERADGSAGERSESAGVSFWQSARCAPDCAPVSTGGEATVPFDPREREDAPQYVGNIVVENPTRETRTVALRVEHEGVTFLRYGYAVPSRVRLRVPAVAWPGAYAVEATSAGVTRTYDWGEAVYYTVSVTLGPDGPTFGCGEVAGKIILVNPTDRERVFAVSVHRDGERLSTGSFGVPAREDRQVATGVTEIGRYSLRVAVGDASVERAWGPCTPVAVTLLEGGELRVSSGKRTDGAGSSPAVTAGRAGRRG